MGVRTGLYARLVEYARERKGRRRAVTLTASEVAGALDCDQRSAYNALQHGARVGAFERTGETQSQPAGRPAPIYRYPRVQE